MSLIFDPSLAPESVLFTNDDDDTDATDDNSKVVTANP